MKILMKKLIRLVITMGLSILMAYISIGGLVLINKLVEILPLWVALIGIPTIFIILAGKSE